MKKILLILLVLVISDTILYTQQTAIYKVIVNASNSVTSISKKDISKMFMKKITKWENGTPVLPVDQLENSPVRKQFSEIVLGKSVAAMQSYWQEQIFSGKGIPPSEKASDKEVIDYVKSNSGAIGYVSVNANVADVKVIEIKD